MEIIERINASVVVTKTSHGREEIILGRDIATNTESEAGLAEDRVNQRFTLQTKLLQRRYVKLVQCVPFEAAQLAAEIIARARALGIKPADSIYLTLTEQLAIAMARTKHHQPAPPRLVFDLAAYFPRETGLGIWALDLVAYRTGITLPQTVGEQLTLTFLQAECEDTDTELDVVLQVMHESLHIVQTEFGYSPNIHSAAYLSFITHLKNFAKRMYHHQPTAAHDRTLIRDINTRYRHSAAVAEKITDTLRDRYLYQPTAAECAHLTLNIERLIYHAQAN
ncbi:PRD domain-containing protein [Lacticaseibacillus camelliae]|uniref:PRD domain-containing protein n=1 Tax=Lacticaseibacillus camelliae DSM 22697 = JCM 13995 TaxID=1423730 RepID=A0A0R2F461_9LACO|nr:PRD domain-containing protein [Lacticaseibacillus camelliae]KRN21077.1 hypothetical protein FC75_GL000007 [Lacticaseibacillus camelliae DSM 22697 = JCM 13995]